MTFAQDHVLTSRHQRHRESGIVFGYGTLVSAYFHLVIVGLWLSVLIEPSLALFNSWLALLAVLIGLIRGRIGVASPFGFAAIYSGYVALVPVTYVAATGTVLFPFIWPPVRPETVQLMTVSWLGILAGASLASLILPRMPVGIASRSPLTGIQSGPHGLLIARALLGAAIGVRALTLIIYGPNSFVQQGSLSGLSAIEPAVTLFLLSAAVLYAGSTRSATVSLRRLDWILFLTVIVASLAIGSRGELIAPAVIVFLSRGVVTRRMVRRGSVVLLAGFLLFAGLETTRQGSRTIPTENGVAASLFIAPIASPSRVADRLTSAEFELRSGSTYGWSLVYALPGPIATAIAGPTHGTGTLEYHEIVNYNGPGGLGFNILAEPYMNFGPNAIAPFALLSGVLLQGFAHTSATGVTLWRRCGSLLVVASVPALMRADALAVVSTVTLPMIFVWLVEKLAGRSRGDSEPQSQEL